ncbi:dodecin family protein [Flavobacterium sp. PL12]|uniref:dodecin family protein n=1 Tax=Flavobacterium sp. PL12 TaxID=3071718 RepID=UPI00319E9412
MSVLKVIEILSSSELSWEDAAQRGVAKASQTIKHIRSVYIKEQSAKVRDGGITEFRVNMKITFELE